MPFTFKLSKRLALSKPILRIVTAAAVVFAACEFPKARVTGPESVVQLVITPPSITLDPSQARQFVAFGRTEAGDSVAAEGVTWSAIGGGSISSLGMYMAPSTAGSYQVVATQQALADTAGVTVMAPPPPPPPPPPPASVLFQEAFEDNAFASRGWYDNTSMVTTTVEHIPGSTRALELRYTAGSTTPVAGGSARRQFTASATVYVSYWVKYSSNWVGSGQAYHPHEFLIVSDQDGAWDGPSQSWLVAYVEHNYQNGGIPRLQLQDNKAINTSFGAPPVNLVSVTENRSTSGCNGVVESNVVTTCFSMPPWYNDKEIHAPRVTFQPTAGPGYKGDWNFVEAYFQLNTIANGKGVANGVMQYWFNGALIIDRHDILFRTAARPTILFDKFMIAPYIGDGSPVNQTMWVDNLTVATSRP